MKTLGIRQTKAHLSQLVRAAAQGECSLITDNRKPVAMIGPPPQDPVEAKSLRRRSPKRASRSPTPPSFARRSSAFPPLSNSTSNDTNGKNMSTWLMDTPLFSMLQTAKAKPLLEWCEANDASLFISAASLTYVGQAINKFPGSQSHAPRLSAGGSTKSSRASPTGYTQSTPRSPRAPARCCQASP